MTKPTKQRTPKQPKAPREPRCSRCGGRAWTDPSCGKGQHPGPVPHVMVGISRIIEPSTPTHPMGECTPATTEAEAREALAAFGWWAEGGAAEAEQAEEGMWLVAVPLPVAEQIQRDGGWEGEAGGWRIAIEWDDMGCGPVIGEDGTGTGGAR